MRLITNLILMVFVTMVMTVNAGTLHTFDIFDVRDSTDQRCFTINKTTEDCTKVNLNKCVVGCGGSVKIIKSEKSQQYTLQIFSNDTSCAGTASTKAIFICPNPSTKPIDVKGTTNSVKCGTLPPGEGDDENNADATEDNGTTKSHSGTTTTTSKPSSHNNGNEISALSEDDGDSPRKSSSDNSDVSSSSSSKSKDKPKSDTEDAAHGNNAISSTFFNGSLIVIALLIATLL